MEEISAELQNSVVGAAGSLIATIRHQRQQSLEQLSKTSGVSLGLLSQLERGRGNPSLSTLVKVAQALETPLSRFFEDTRESTTLIRADARPRLITSDEGLVYELMTPRTESTLGVVRAVVTAGWTNQETPFIHEGTECLTVLSGELVAHIGGSTYVLSTGDALTYDSGTPHWYHNRTSHPAVTLGFMNPPNF